MKFYKNAYNFSRYYLVGNRCKATYPPSHKDEQDMLTIIRTNSQVMFSRGLLHMDTPVWVDQ